MLAKLVEQGNVQTLPLKVLSSAHLEKDFTMIIDPRGIVPQQGETLNGAGYENGPRRQEFDGFTYFGVEDGVKNDEDDVSSKDGAGATGGYIEDATGKQVLKKEMNDFIIPSNNPNNSDASKEQPSSINPMMGGGNNHQGRQFYIQFDPLDRLYKIRDLGKGYGAFAKLQGSIIIRDSFLVNIGESYVVSYLINNQDELLICKGGKGGFGNLRYKSSTNRSPTKFTEGKEGDSLSLRLELRLLADIGLLGKPNAGKSSLVRAVSSAKPKVADYAFTTLHPSLGVIDYSENSSFVISDIPGLIAGASEGVGLGIQFLKHLSRTKVIVQIVDVYDKNPMEVITEIRELSKEITNYDPDLIKKVKWLALNKIDLINTNKLEELKDELGREFQDNLHIYCISAAKKEGTQQLMRDIGEFMETSDE